MKNNQSGRTMLEMLCVLAIIAVLTLGGLKGYQYMVERYKANKIAEAFAFIVTQIRAGYSTQESYAGINNDIAIEIGAIPEQITLRGTAGGSNAQGRGQLETPWGGFINIFPSALHADSMVVDPDTGATVALGDSFIVEIGNISRKTCTLLITNAWGNISNAGFVGIASSSKTCSNVGNMGVSVTNAGGCTSSASSSVGLDGIYLNTDYETRADHTSNGVGYAYGIPGSRKWGIPVSPVTASKGCNCIDDNDMEVTTCSFAAKFY